MDHLIIIETGSCVNNCIFCLPGRKKKLLSRRDLTEIGELILRQAVDLQQRGIRDVELSGADPAGYPWLAGFIRMLKARLGFHKIYLATHGRDLAVPEFLAELAAAGLDGLRIPFYGPEAAVHEAVTQIPGSFSATLRGVENVVRTQPQIRLILTSLFLRQNFSRTSETYRLMSCYASEMSFGWPCAANMMSAEASFPGLALRAMVPPAELGGPVRELVGLAQRGQKPCVIVDVPVCVAGLEHERLLSRGIFQSSAFNNGVAWTYKGRKEARNHYSRIKTRIPACSRCSAVRRCGGFFVSHTKLFDLSGVQPLS